MKRILFPLILLFVGFGSSFGQNSPMLTYGELLEALKRGYAVRATFYYAKCDLFIADKKQDKSPDVVGGMPVDVFEYFGRNTIGNSKSYIAFSEAKLIANPLGAGYIYNYAKARVYEDGKVTISIRYVDPITFENKMTEEFQTTLYNGTNNDAGAYFFVSH